MEVESPEKKLIENVIGGQLVRYEDISTVDTSNTIFATCGKLPPQTKKERKISLAHVQRYHKYIIIQINRINRIKAIIKSWTTNIFISTGAIYEDLRKYVELIINVGGILLDSLANLLQAIYVKAETALQASWNNSLNILTCIVDFMENLIGFVYPLEKSQKVSEGEAACKLDNFTLAIGSWVMNIAKGMWTMLKYMVINLKNLTIGALKRYAYEAKKQYDLLYNYLSNALTYSVVRLIENVKIQATYTLKSIVDIVNKGLGWKSLTNLSNTLQSYINQSKQTVDEIIEEIYTTDIEYINNSYKETPLLFNIFNLVNNLVVPITTGASSISSFVTNQLLSTSISALTVSGYVSIFAAIPIVYTVYLATGVAYYMISYDSCVRTFCNVPNKEEFIELALGACTSKCWETNSILKLFVGMPSSILKILVAGPLADNPLIVWLLKLFVDSPITQFAKMLIPYFDDPHNVVDVGIGQLVGYASTNMFPSIPSPVTALGAAGIVITAGNLAPQIYEKEAKVFDEPSERFKEYR